MNIFTCKLTRLHILHFFSLSKKLSFSSDFIFFAICIIKTTHKSMIFKEILGHKTMSDILMYDPSKNFFSLDKNYWLKSLDIASLKKPTKI